MKIKLILGASLLLLVSVQVNAAILDFNADGTVLNGASNVEVAGSFYDVQFIGGSCVSLLSGCDQPTDFLFGTGSLADEASQSLIDQVFNGLDPGSGLAGSAFVVNSITSDSNFFIATYVHDLNPNSVFLDAVLITTNEVVNTCGIAACGFDINTDLATDGAWTTAIWSEAGGLNPVPAPAAIWLFGTALIGLVGFGRRKLAA